MGILMKSFVMDGGERYCLLVDRCFGLPLYYPSLFVTTQVRNRSLSYSAMESALGGIAVLLRFMAERNDDLEARFRKHQFLEINELDAIRDFCQIKFRVRAMDDDSHWVFTLEELRQTNEKVYMIHGIEHQEIPPKHPKTLAKATPSASLTMIQGLGHNGLSYTAQYAR